MQLYHSFQKSLFGYVIAFITATCLFFNSILPCIAQSGQRIPKTKRYKTISVKAYRHVQGKGGYGTGKKFAYPAPAGEEDNELIVATRTFVTAKLELVSPEKTVPFRNPFGTENGDPMGDPGAIGPGWWFSQVVGNDLETHLTRQLDLDLVFVAL